MEGDHKCTDTHGYCYLNPFISSLVGQRLSHPFHSKHIFNGKMAVVHTEILQEPYSTFSLRNSNQRRAAEVRSNVSLEHFVVSTVFVQKIMSPLSFQRETYLLPWILSIFSDFLPWKWFLPIICCLVGLDNFSGLIYYVLVITCS